jgi:hypothetical protein
MFIVFYTLCFYMPPKDSPRTYASPLPASTLLSMHARKRSDRKLQVPTRSPIMFKLDLPEYHALQTRYITFFSRNFKVAVYYPR